MRERVDLEIFLPSRPLAEGLRYSRLPPLQPFLRVAAIPIASANESASAQTLEVNQRGERSAQRVARLLIACISGAELATIKAALANTEHQRRLCKSQINTVVQPTELIDAKPRVGTKSQIHISPLQPAIVPLNEPTHIQSRHWR